MTPHEQIQKIQTLQAIVEAQKLKNIELRAMLIDLETKVEKLEKSSVTGLGGVGRGVPVGLTSKLEPEEFQAMAPARLKTASLEDVVRAEAEHKGETEDEYLKKAVDRARSIKNA